MRIGHASIDERGKASGGEAGDQTGKEVCSRSWYGGGWQVLLRAKDRAVGQRIAEACRKACDNDLLGYDQSGRNTGLQEAQKVNWDFSQIQRAAEFDCSSLCAACVEAAGVHVWDGGNAPTTRTLERVLLGTGAFEALRSSQYLTEATYLRAGDILLKPGSHVVMALEDGSKAEVSDPGTTAAKADIVTVYYSLRLPLLKKGMAGEPVKAMQQLLMAKGEELPQYGADGDYGKETEKALTAYQKRMGLDADAKCGKDTWGALLGLTGAG